MQNVDSETFFNDWFHAGVPHERVIGEEFVDQYSVQSYLAYLTAGEHVAVGQLELQKPVAGRSEPGVESFLVYEMTAVIIPDVGVFLCEPVFSGINHAKRNLAECVAELEVVLGESIDKLPVYPLLVSVMPELAKSSECFGVSFFSSPVDHLLSTVKQPVTAELANETISRVMRSAYFMDSKQPGAMDHWPIPWWVAAVHEMEGMSSVA